MTKDELIAFEADIAAEFNAGHIRAPVHLSGGNEDQLIKIFEGIRSHDFIFTTWRSHYHCLLKGVPPDLLKSEIMAGRSISLCFPDHLIYSSAMVGGSIPIAVGMAMAIKLAASEDKVFVFCGEMASQTGIAHEAMKYARNFGLPIHFIIEDNGLSVCTPTEMAWHMQPLPEGSDDCMTIYKYKNPWPHAGGGRRIMF